MQQHISQSGVFILIDKASCISHVCCDFHCSRSFCWRFPLLLSRAFLCRSLLGHRRCRFMRSRPVRAMATFGPPVIGAMVPAAITGYLVHGCLRLNLASFGPQAIGAGVEAFTLGIPVIGDRMLGSTAASITD